MISLISNQIHPDQCKPASKVLATVAVNTNSMTIVHAWLHVYITGEIIY